MRDQRKHIDVANCFIGRIMTQILCSYVTLPLYALVIQMGSNMKPTIFNKRVVKALHTCHQNAKKQIQKNHPSGSDTPMSSGHSSPLHGSSPAHLLQYYKSELDNVNLSPANSISRTKSCQEDFSLSYQITSHEEMESQHHSPPHPFDHEINSADFSFEKTSEV